MPEDAPIRRPSTLSLGAVTFEREFEHWLRTRGSNYYLDLTDEQVARVVERAAAIARAHGMKP